MSGTKDQDRIVPVSAVEFLNHIFFILTKNKDTHSPSVRDSSLGSVRQGGWPACLSPALGEDALNQCLLARWLPNNFRA